MPVSEPAAWSLECSGCGATRDAAGLPGVCDCGQPYLVRYRSTPAPEVKARLPGRGWTMWRYREWLPLADAEAPITLGEGGTPLQTRSEEHTSELQSLAYLVCRLLLEKKKKK